MYKSSGKKYKGGGGGGGGRDNVTQGGKYRSSSGYNSDVYRTEDDDEYDDLNEYADYGNSPDYYYTAAAGGGGGHQGKSSGNSYNTHHHSGGHSKSNLNYYSGSKSHDRYYSGYDTSHGKHKGGLKEPAYKLNKYQTIVLKVQIHCAACIRKVKKAIAEIDGVESISVDQKQKKVSVTGYIDPKKVVKKVAKTGKTVELVGGGAAVMSKDDHVNMLSNKAALIMAASDHHRSNIHHPAMLTGVSSMKPYTVQVDKSSSRSNNNVHVPPQYIRMTTPQVRSDMDYMFSDDNANSCSIM